jgi:hypothetical protein
MRREGEGRRGKKERRDRERMHRGEGKRMRRRKRKIAHHCLKGRRERLPITHDWGGRTGGRIKIHIFHALQHRVDVNGRLRSGTVAAFYTLRSGVPTCYLRMHCTRSSSQVSLLSRLFTFTKGAPINKGHV